MQNFDVIYCGKIIGRVSGRDYQKCLKDAVTLAETLNSGKIDKNKVRLQEPKDLESRS